MLKTNNAIIIDFTELKEKFGFNRIIANVYIDADNNRLVIETEPNSRPGDLSSIQPIGEKIMDGTEYNTYRQDQLRKANGRRVDQSIFD
jgi:hypothetical protein